MSKMMPEEMPGKKPESQKRPEIIWLSLFLVVLFSYPAVALADESSPALLPSVAMHGEVKYKNGFKCFDYVNQNAPKGGVLKQHAIGTFDSLNPFILKGNPAAGLGMLGQSLIYDSLMTQSYDEPFSMYGLLAETIEMPDNNQWVAFNINPKARWHDGKAVTADDVVWTFNTLIEKGSPFFRAYYADVAKVEATDRLRVKFTFSHGGNSELPLIISQIPILPRHYWEERIKSGKKFDSTSLEPPLGSGAYKITKVLPGKSIEYERVADYWGKELPVNCGRFNFDKIVYDYYKDSNIALEAFLAGEYDVRVENTAKLWATAYDVPQVKDGRIIKEEIKNQRPQGMQGFLYNIRRPIFQDIRVRQALAYAFDFEWSNRQFAYSAYKRTDSYFENSELAAKDGKPEGRVREILQELGKPADLPRYKPPVTDGSGNLRNNLKKAVQLLESAGYKLGKDGVRINEETGQRLEFEIIDGNPMFERWVLPFIANLKKIGVKASFRKLDPAQYQNRMQDFDFDMTIGSFGQSSSPGNEQLDFWGAEKADIKGSRNYIGIKDPAIDKLIRMIINAPDREELVYRTRALDRILLSGYYLIPHWHIDYWRIAYWNKLQRPEKLSPITPAIYDTWWIRKKEEEQQK